MRNKKILGLLLAGVMVTSIPFNVFADEPTEGASETLNPPAQGETLEKTPTAGDGTEVTYKLTFKFSDGRPDEVKTAKVRRRIMVVWIYNVEWFYIEQYLIIFRKCRFCRFNCQLI